MQTHQVQPKVRSEIWNLIFAQLPDDAEISKGISDVFHLILDSVKPEQAKEVQEAIFMLEDLHSSEINTAIEQAFALGWQLAKDAATLVFES